MEQFTEQDKIEAAAFLPDCDILLKTFNGLGEQMTSEAGKQFCAEFCEKAVPFLRSMKAEILVALDMI